MKPVSPEKLKQRCDMYGSELCVYYVAKARKRKEPCTYGVSHGIKYCPHDLLTVVNEMKEIHLANEEKDNE